jgi:hypothetical protein
VNSRTDKNKVILRKIHIREHEIGWWIYFVFFAELKKLPLRCKNFFERFVGLKCLEGGGYIVKNQFLRK